MKMEQLTFGVINTQRKKLKNFFFFNVQSINFKKIYIIMYIYLVKILELSKNILNYQTI